MKAVLLAAGEGVRMRPLTSTRSKHMIFLAGKPILEHCLLSLTEAGFKEALVVVGYERELIKQYFGDGSKFGIRLNYIEQERVLGTANALQLAEDYVEDEPFLATYGDLLITPRALRFLLAKHKAGTATTISIVPVSQPEQYGAVKLKDDKIVSIVEKPKLGAAPSNLANAGIYIFTSEINEY